MSQESQAHNEISGQVPGNAVQAGQIHGDVTASVQYIHSVHQSAVAPPRLNPWLVYAGVLALLAAVGLAGVASRTTNYRETVALFYALWLLWTAVHLWTRTRQARQAARSSAQFALYVWLIVFGAALGVSWPLLGLYALAAGSALICLLCSPVALRPRRVVAVLTGVVACASWYVPHLVLLWSDGVDVSVPLGILGTLLLLVVIAVPVHAVLTAPGERAVRVLRSWAFCLFIATFISQGFSRYDDPLVLKWLQVLGVIAAVVLSGHVKDKT